MPCFRPNQAIQDYPGAKLRFTNYDREAHAKMKGALYAPCGQCSWCRLNRATQTAVRITHEQQTTTDHEFITLTFAPEHLPSNWSLDHSYWQKFMKRVRKLYGQGPRYYMCGEYGDNLGRPHFHAIMFNFPLRDKVELFGQGDRKYYTSATLQKLWPYGHVMTTNVTFASAQYVARYVLKKVTGKKADEHYRVMILATGEEVQLQPEYTQCSKRPGIGLEWYKKYAKTDLFPKDYCNVISSSGPFKVVTPRYYMKKLEMDDPELYKQIKARRMERAKESAPDNTPERLLAKEQLALEQARQRLQAEAARKYKGSGYDAKNLQYIRCQEHGL